jgi:hypothetical protein
MIYSKSNNFLLLKNQKVGGTSLEVVLSKIMPEDAVVTPRTSDDPAWAIKDEIQYPGYRPRNYKELYNHISYSEISKVIDLSNTKSYIFIRNPFDMVLSHFFHRLKMQKIETSWNSLEKINKENLVDLYFNNQLGWEWLKSNKNIYTSNSGEIQVSEFLRYESGIEKEINKILPNHSLPKIKLDVYEKAFKPKDIKCLDVFNKKYIDIIKNEWWWELEYFRY